MATSLNRQKRDPSQFSTALSYAFSEWILIILLLVDAFCLFLVSKVFRSCKLRTPCLLCSRFGNLLGNEKLGYYRNLICDAHKLEVSSLAFCHIHEKLADEREMCEICLLSFARKMSTLESYRTFLSKLNMEIEDGDQILNTSSNEIVKVSLLNKDHDVGSPRIRPCSCCSQLSRNKPYAYRQSQNKPYFKEFSDPRSPLSSTRLRARAHLQDGLSKAKEVLSMPFSDYKLGGHSFGRLSHFRYRELKITSEPESEVPLSDDDNGSSKPCRIEEVKDESVEESLKSSSSITNAPRKSVISDDIVIEKLNHPDPIISVASSSVLRSQFDEDGFCDKSFVESNFDTDHGLKEINCAHFEGKPNPPTSPQIVSKPVSTRISNVKGISDRTNLINRTSQADTVMIDSDHNLSSNVIGAQPPLISEITLARESTRLHEDLKQRLSQVPSPRWLQSPWTDIIHDARKDDKCKLSHTLSFNGLPSTNKKLDVELSYLESTNGITINEVEGDVSVARLKRQLEIDRKSMSIIYKELEEERNASAIAANQAMAMINKLQEEKAAMQLEVMQYLRVMEEQTEYEQEALRNLNDQLTEREKEIQDLEAELESCRKPSRDESKAEKVLQPLVDSDGSEYSTTSTPHVVRPRRRKKQHLPGVMLQDSERSTVSIKENLLDFEDEREYISECLKRLEKNVRLFSSADASRLDEENDEFNDEKYADDSKRMNLELQQCFVQDEGTNQMEEIISSENDPSPHIKSLHLDAKCISSTLEAECHVGENGNYNRLNTNCTSKIKLKRSNRNGRIALSHEVEHLNARVEALEADRDFLNRTINSLRYGKDGLQFVREIATHLRELRKFGLTQREGLFA